jgi:hypothetical protein
MMIEILKPVTGDELELYGKLVRAHRALVAREGRGRFPMDSPEWAAYELAMLRYVGYTGRSESKVMRELYRELEVGER